MAALAPNADGVPSLTQEYNKHSSLGTKIKNLAIMSTKHILVMGVMMGAIGIFASPIFAAAPIIDPFTTNLLTSSSPTIGDVALQSTYGAGEMLNMIGEAFKSVFSIAKPIITNAFEGNWAPTTLDSTIISHSAEHAVTDLALNADALRFDEWIRNAQTSGDLSYAIEDSKALGITLEEYIMDYGHDAH